MDDKRFQELDQIYNSAYQDQGASSSASTPTPTPITSASTTQPTDNPNQGPLSGLISSISNVGNEIHNESPLWGLLGPLGLLGGRSSNIDPLHNQILEKHPGFDQAGLGEKVGNVAEDVGTNAMGEVVSMIDALKSIPGLFDQVSKDSTAASHPLAGLFGPAVALASNPTMQNVLGSVVGGTAKNIGDLVTNPVGHAYNKPIDTAMNVYQLVNLLDKVSPEVNPDDYGNPVQQPKKTVPIDQTDQMNPNFSVKGEQARNVINPDVDMEKIGSLSKARNISKNVIDITKGKRPIGIANDIEKIYQKVNDKIDSLLDSPEGKKNIMLDAPSGVPGGNDSVMKRLSDNIAGDPLTISNPNEAMKADGYIKNLLQTDDLLYKQLTTPQKIQEIRTLINKNISGWIRSGRPIDTPNGAYFHFLEKMNQGLGDILGQEAPLSRELVSVQANLLPANIGLVGKLAPQETTIPLSHFGLASKVFNSAVDPIRIAIARNPNSEFASRLKYLLDEGPAAQIMQSTPNLPAVRPDLTVPYLIESLLGGNSPYGSSSPKQK